MQSKLFSTQILLKQPEADMEEAQSEGDGERRGNDSSPPARRRIFTALLSGGA